MELLTDATFETALAETPAGVLLFFKELCPHCKNMEKVLDKFAAMEPAARLFAIDIEKNPAAAAAFGAERPPTLFVIKNGKEAARKAGLMNPKELLALYKKS